MEMKINRQVVVSTLLIAGTAVTAYFLWKSKGGQDSKRINNDTGESKENSDSTIKRICKQCFLVKNALSKEEQIKIFAYITEKDKTDWNEYNNKPIPISGRSAKTLVLGENDIPTLRFEYNQESIINDLMISNVNNFLKENKEYVNIMDEFEFESFEYNHLSVGVIRYESPNGNFPLHIDHSNSIVYLLSIGCTCNFMVKGPTMEKRNDFKMDSGDILVFNATTKAKIVHGVKSIDNEETSPKFLSDKYPIMVNHRFGVQCRMQF